MRQIIQSISIFSFILLLVFAVHLFILNHLQQPLFDNRIIAAYLVNYFMAILLYLLLYFLKDKFTEQLGFIFMGGSLFKFILFFIFFYPYYRADQNTTSFEFAAFFTPYAICLFFETFGVIKFLKK